MDKSAETYLKQKYREIFDGVEIEIQTAGRDLSNYISNGAFWGTGKIVRHIMGSSAMYEGYADIITRDTTAPFYKKINAAKEGCGYALGKRDIEQFFRFLLYGASLKQINPLINELAYKCACHYIKECMRPQSWFYDYADIACEIAFKVKLSGEYPEFHSMLIEKCAQLYNGHDNTLFLYLRGLAYYGNPEEAKFIDECRIQSRQDTYYKCQLEKAKKMWREKGYYQNI